MLNLLRKSAARKQAAQALYDKLVVRAREPVFFAEVPDTIDGRFDLLALHAWLVLARLKTAGMDPMAQDLTDIVFTGFDEALREQGAGDMSMGRRMKAIANAFFGRLAVYEAATAGAQDALAAALAHNVWRGAAVDSRARALAAYVVGAKQSLESSAPEGLDFGPLPDWSGALICKP